jgi:hypothetical protein
MGNQEWSTIGTQDPGRRQKNKTHNTQHRKLKRRATMTSPKTVGEPMCSGMKPQKSS